MYKTNKENILMLRENLDNIPDYLLPEDFYFTLYEDNDIDAWLDIQNQADTNNNFMQQRFFSTFNNDTESLKSRLIFICNKAGKKIATSTAWHEDKKTALVHWVAIIPSYQGKGLAKPLLAQTLKQMAKLGYKKAILRTKPFRVPAINLYLKFSFKPYICCKEDLPKWDEAIDNFKKVNLDYNVVTLNINRD